MAYLREVEIVDQTTGSPLSITNNGKINVNEIGSITGEIILPTGAATESTLNSIDGKDFATESTLGDLEGKDFATEATLGSVLTKQSDKTQYVKLTDGTEDVEVTTDGRLKIAASFDETGSGFDVHLTDSDTGVHANVSDSGELSVITPPPTVPIGAVGVYIGGVTYPGKNGGEIDTTYTVNTGSTLQFQRFNGGTEASNVTASGGKVELWFDPDADMGVNKILLSVAYLDSSNFTTDLNYKVIGDGTKRIVMRATNWSSSNGKEFAIFFQGYEV